MDNEIVYRYSCSFDIAYIKRTLFIHSTNLLYSHERSVSVYKAVTASVSDIRIQRKANGRTNNYVSLAPDGIV